LRSIGAWPVSIAIRLAAASALVCCVFIAADAQSVPEGDAASGSTLDFTVASRARQLQLLKRNIQRWGCDQPSYATSVVGCRQLNAQATALAASLTELKTRAGGRWTDDAETTARPVTPPRPKVLTYRWRTNPNGSYRTLCVRLCDGSYYPMSEATQPGNFLADEEKCQSSCPSSSAKLFYHANPGQEVEQMVALDGERYADMANAFRFRTEYVKDCRCKPEPWSVEAKAEYDKRTIVATRSTAGQSVAAGVEESAKIAAGGDIVVAKEEQGYGQAGAFRPRARYRYSRYGYDPRLGYDAGNGYGAGYSDGSRGADTRDGYFTRSGYDSRGVLTGRNSTEPPPRRGFFLFGSR
jgi:hypothetical protein